jgi:hypothetical protein
MSQCEYSVYYQCTNVSEDGGHYCTEHLATTCIVCKKQATHNCAYEGQFVCGAPLCDNCTGYNEEGKSSGNWGFMNHSHKGRSEC